MQFSIWDANLAFVWSRMRVVNECVTVSRSRVVQVYFILYTSHYILYTFYFYFCLLLCTLFCLLNFILPRLSLACGADFKYRSIKSPSRSLIEVYSIKYNVALACRAVDIRRFSGSDRARRITQGWSGRSMQHQVSSIKYKAHLVALLTAHYLLLTAYYLLLTA